MHIDWWTLALQAVNVLILVWILGRFFYRPVADIVEKRRAAAVEQLAKAAAAQAAVDAAKAEIAATRAGFAAERDAFLAEARRQAQAEHDAALKQAQGEIARLRAQNAAELARDRRKAQDAIVGHAGALAVEIAGKLLATLPPGASTASFLAALADQLRTLPARSRSLLAAAADSGGLGVTTAAPLTADEQERCRAVIDAALGTTAKIAFRSDPALIAGIELRSDALILGINWRDHLAAIAQHIQGHDGSDALS